MPGELILYTTEDGASRIQLHAEGGTVIRRNERLVKLLNGVGEMRLGDYKDNTIDAFGDAYEFLMGMYASNAGKSGGEYYTPQEVSELLTKITLTGKTEVNKVYDPACGSGSLLLKFAKILGVEQEDKREVVDIKKLNAEIEAIVGRENKLRAEIAAIIAEIERSGE